MKSPIPITTLMLCLVLNGCNDAPPFPGAGRHQDRTSGHDEPKSPVSTVIPQDPDTDRTIDGGDGAPEPVATTQIAAPTGPARPMLLDFTRDHCMPCTIMSPWVAQLRAQLKGVVDVTEINIDRPKNKPMGMMFKVHSIPTQVYVSATGEELKRNVGLATKDQMIQTLTTLGLMPSPPPP